MPKTIYKEWQLMGLHVVLVTLHEQFTSSIKTNRIGDTKYNP